MSDDYTPSTTKDFADLLLNEAEALDDRARARFLREPTFAAKVRAAHEFTNATYLSGLVPVEAVALVLHLTDLAAQASQVEEAAA